MQEQIWQHFSTLNLYDSTEVYNFYKKIHKISKKIFEDIETKNIQNEDIIYKLTSDMPDETTYQIVQKMDDLHWYHINQIKEILF